jgi:hypothetical protein
VIMFFVILSAMVFAPDILLSVHLLDEEIFIQSIPAIDWYSRTIRNGDSFLWTSGILGGFPIAFTQYSFFSPLDWVVAYFLHPNLAYIVVQVIYLPLAGIASYFYARAIGIDRLPAILAGVGYQLSTEALALGANGYVLRSLFVLPALLLSAELIVQKSARWAILSATALGISFISGQIYVTSIALFSACIYVLARSIQLWKSKQQKTAFRLTVSLGLAVILAIGLAAVRILPSIVVAAESVRAQGITSDYAAGISTEVPVLLAGYLLPLTRLFGLGIADPPSYVGPFILILGIASVFRINEGKYTPVLFVLLLLNILISLGNNGPIYGILHNIPPFTHFRAPSRFSIASAFFIAILAATVLNNVETKCRSKVPICIALKAIAIMSTILFVVALAAGLLWVYGGQLGDPIRSYAEINKLGPINPIRPRVALALIAIPTSLWFLWSYTVRIISKRTLQISSITITTCLLLSVGISLIPREARSQQIPATVHFLNQDESRFRILSFRPHMSRYLCLLHLAGGDPNQVNPDGPRELSFRSRFLSEAIAPNFALQYGLESVDGYEVLQSVRQAIAASYLGSENAEIANLEHIGSLIGVEKSITEKLTSIQSRNLLDHLPVLRAFNVKYVLTNLELFNHPDQLSLVFSSQVPMLDPNTATLMHVYEIKDVLPRAYLVPNSIEANNVVDALDTILFEKVDLTQNVILEQPFQHLTDDVSRLTLVESSVKIAVYENHEIILNVHTDGSGFLVINDSYYPGWSATVNGKPTPIYVANGWVRAIPIEAKGNHTVRLTYNPPLFTEGIFINVASLIIFIIVIFAPFLTGPSIKSISIRH